MTYEEIVYQVRDAFENVDARKIFEHIAVQVNIEGEGSGSFYIEVANRTVIVEPYDYYDRDGLLTASAETLIAISKGELSLREAVDSDKMLAIGNRDKLNLLFTIKVKKKEKKSSSPAKKPAAKAPKAAKEPAEKTPKAAKEPAEKSPKAAKETKADK